LGSSKSAALSGAALLVEYGNASNGHAISMKENISPGIRVRAEDSVRAIWVADVQKKQSYRQETDGLHGHRLSARSKNPFARAVPARIIDRRASVAGRKSEQAKDGFDGNPRGHRMLCSVSRRSEFPAADGLGGALIQAKTDTLDDADIVRPSIRAHENL